MQFTDYEDLYFHLIDMTTGPDEDEEFDDLPECAQALLIAAIFDMEILNGGLCQFFVNCGSAYATRIADSLRMIGLEAMGTIYQSFLAANQIDPKDLSSFQCDTIESFAAQYDRYPYDDFEKPYMELWEKLNFNETMVRYANANADALVQA